MKIAVCIKQVPTREWQPRLNDDKTWIRDQDVSYEMNEPDAYALEEALRLREKHGGEVVVCSAGPARVQQVIDESMLLMAQDEEQGGRGMSDEQVRDEAMTIFLAGHETTANALSWTWYFLSQSPEAETRLHEEVDRVLGERTPTLADLPQLQYVEQVVTESMRLYPPAYVIGRRAIGPYTAGGFTLPPRTLLLMSPYVMGRDARFFPEPERFNPGRWTPEFKQRLPPFAYFPFGGGTRRCIGEGFAWMELVLVVAALARRWRLRLVPGHPIVPQPLVTLRLKHGLRMTTEAR